MTSFATVAPSVATYGVSLEGVIMKKSYGSLLVACTLLVAACGGSSSEGSDDDAIDETTTTAEAISADDSSPDDNTGDDNSPDDSTDDGSTADEVATATDDSSGDDGLSALRPILTATPATAGPITVTPSVCTVNGVDLSGPSGVESLAFAGERAFVSNELGVLAFAFTGGPDCSLTLDTGLGTDGVMTDDDSLSSLSGNAAGRLVASGVLGSMVYDTNEGFSYECTMTGYPTLSDDGTRVLSNFPGREALEEWELTDTICNEVGEVAFPELLDIKFVGFDGSDLLVGGENTAEVVTVSRYQGGTPVWQAGTEEIGAPGWFGWVHGVAPCGPFTCMIDTNTDKLALIDDGGAVVAAFEFSELVGGDRGWIEPLLQGPDGAAYVLLDSSVDVDDERTYFGTVVRLDVTG